MSFTVEDFRYLPFRLMEYNRAALEREENPASGFGCARTGASAAQWGALQRQVGEEEDRLFWEAVKAIEEEKRMPYVTTGERIGMEKGLQQGSLEEGRAMLIEA